MDKLTRPRSHALRRVSADSPAKSLLEALDIDPDTYDLASAAAFRALAEEVISLREEEARLRTALAASEELADRDGLCPVFNRRAFQRELSREIARARRHGAQLCFIYLDLDRFKDVNDRFGHAAGDAALKQVCEILLSNLRQSDIVGRLGGDEFGVILPHAGLEDGRHKAGRLSEKIDQIVIKSPGKGPAPVHLGVSCGVVAWSGDLSAEQLISQADEAMFRQKSGRHARRASAS